MKVIIFGATGGTGKQLIERSLNKGYETFAFVHDNPQQLIKYQDKITVFLGDVRDFDVVNKAIIGQDAVLVALGVIPGRTQYILSEGTANIIRSMEMNAVKKLVVETGAGLAANQKQLPFLWRLVASIPPMREMFDDKRKQEEFIMGSKLDWVIVRPANLTNGPLTSNYNIGEQLILRTSSTISRADVANFMINQITSSEWLKKAVLIEKTER